MRVLPLLGCTHLNASTFLVNGLTLTRGTVSRKKGAGHSACRVSGRFRPRRASTQGKKPAEKSRFLLTEA